MQNICLLASRRRFLGIHTPICCALHSAGRNIQDVVVLGVARTPIGSFQKSLAACSATSLGSVAIKGAVLHSSVTPETIQECYMGLVLSASTKQAPAKQAALMAGLNIRTPCTTVNKVCASGMKSVMLAAQAIALGHEEVVCAGGMESMSNAPYYLPRKPLSYGGVKLFDSITHDALSDPKYDMHMGQCAEKLASDMKITREEQDEFAKMSYERSQAAALSGVFKSEIVAVQVPDKKGINGFTEVIEDEEYKRVDFTRFPKLKPAFVGADKGGTVTAANASTLNDGAAAMILSSANFASRNRNLKPLARIVAYADAATDPIDFPIAPHLAVQKLLTHVELKVEDIDLWEINEAFSVVVLGNTRLLGIPLDRVNINGGAVSCGHPVGMSGARITNHLVLQLKPGQKGIATVCNGGGGASAILLEKL